MSRIPLVALSALFALGLYAQDDAATQTPQFGRGGRGAVNADPQPYDRVITKDAKTSKGLFTIHQVKDNF